MERAYGVILKVCPVCGKEFVPAPWHVYKDKRKGGNRKFVCSYGCMRKSEREKKPSKPIVHRVYVRKPVKCIETGEVFECAKAAATTIKADASRIRSACRGERDTVKGYHWAYMEDVEE